MAAALLHPERFDTPAPRRGRHLHVVPELLPEPTPAAERRAAVVPDAATLRRRRVIALVAVLAMCWLLWEAALTARTMLAAPVGSGELTVVVQPGDSMWSIARAHQPVGDIRPLVDLLIEANGSAELVPGQLVQLSW